MRPVLGLVTIGQSPRPDLESVFRRFAPEVDIEWAGALDDLDRLEIAALEATSDVYPLHTRIADGSTVDISIDVLAPLVAERAASLASNGAHLIVVVCAGGFPEFECLAPVILPGTLLPAVLKTFCRSRRIGIVTPNVGQIEPARQKWQDDGFDARVVSASPYRSGEVQDAAAALVDPDIELVVLDCMGHDTDYQREFARLCGRPVMLAQTLVARVAAEYLDGVVTRATVDTR